MARILICGAGWGTALAVMAHDGGHDVTLWTPFEAEVEAMRCDGEHKKLLPGVAIPPEIRLTTELPESADLVLIAVPSFAIAETAGKLAGLPAGTLVVNAGKGLEQETHRRFSEVLAERLPGKRVAVLSGPSHAEEVGRRMPTSIVCAAADLTDAVAVQELLLSPRFRVYTSTDVAGVELGGALKNIIALACGIAIGLNTGDNAQAALMTRGLAEIARCGVALGAQAHTFAGLSGMGDLIVTCGSEHSRNRRAGKLIGQGVPPAEAVAQVGTVEGFLAAKAGFALARQMGIDMPITEECYRVCYEDKDPRQALRDLITRPGKSETEPVWF
ncbi:MAG: NAD(P)-dependent glycerol-3-phosphate dehydrogenase [Oscillospiraceae bacterium]|nr:NAD(P)-dependent glycerol-3-phosphate dehydrogenase [Oscillospiraceae bacterium]